MEKLRLELDELRLQSFVTSDALSQHCGTVNGHENPTEEAGCTAGDTCALSCACNTGDCTAICQSDACTYDQCVQDAGYATFITSGG